MSSEVLSLETSQKSWKTQNLILENDSSSIFNLRTAILTVSSKLKNREPAEGELRQVECKQIEKPHHHDVVFQFFCKGIEPGQK